MYRVIRSSWGISIAIDAEVFKNQWNSGSAYPVGTNLFVIDGTPGARLSDNSMRMLVRGLTPLYCEIAAIGLEKPIKVIVRDVRYNDADFQEEGLAAAIHGWAIAEFDLPERDIAVTFSKEANRYLFDLPDSC